MVDVRRAYRTWLLRRLSWLVPSFLLSCVVLVRLATAGDLPIWARVPSLALAGGVGALVVALLLQSVRVLRERSEGSPRKAQLLRLELRATPAVAAAALLLLLGLLGIPWLVKERPSAAAPVVRRPPPVDVVRTPAEPVTPAASAVPVEIPAVIEESPVETAGPQILPEIARVFELPLSLEDLERRLPAPVQELGARAESPRLLKDRPGYEDDLFDAVPPERKRFGRSGVPWESDAGAWVPPHLQVEVMLVSRSGPWRGSGLEVDGDLPVGRDDSVRLTYTAMLLSDEAKLAGLEPTFTWNRGTLEYLRRIAGYARESTFDFALIVGLSVDHLSTHEASLHLSGAPRISPCFGFEMAVWEDDEVGLVAQFTHSPATRLTGGSSRVTDFKVLVRIDLGEHSLLELGYRLLSVRFSDRQGPSDEAYTDKMERSFMGPIVGLSFRF